MCGITVMATRYGYTTRSIRAQNSCADCVKTDICSGSLPHLQCTCTAARINMPSSVVQKVRSGKCIKSYKERETDKKPTEARLTKSKNVHELEHCVISQRLMERQYVYIDLRGTIGLRARGLGRCSPQSHGSGKTIIFRAKAKFFEQKPTAKNEKIVFIKRKNQSHCF